MVGQGAAATGRGAHQADAEPVQHAASSELHGEDIADAEVLLHPESLPERRHGAVLPFPQQPGRSFDVLSLNAADRFYALRWVAATELGRQLKSRLANNLSLQGPNSKLAKKG